MNGVESDSDMSVSRARTQLDLANERVRQQHPQPKASMASSGYGKIIDFSRAMFAGTVLLSCTCQIVYKPNATIQRGKHGRPISRLWFPDHSALVLLRMGALDLFEAYPGQTSVG